MYIWISKKKKDMKTDITLTAFTLIIIILLHNNVDLNIFVYFIIYVISIIIFFILLISIYSRMWENISKNNKINFKK